MSFLTYYLVYVYSGYWGCLLQIFEHVHAPEEMFSYSVRVGARDSDGRQCQAEERTVSPRLHCYDVWYAGQLPWSPSKHNRDDEASIHNAGIEDGTCELTASDPVLQCLFSVVQSSTQVHPSEVLDVLNQLHG
jgi:hypothetical protein